MAVSASSLWQFDELMGQWHWASREPPHPTASPGPTGAGYIGPAQSYRQIATCARCGHMIDDVDVLCGICQADDAAERRSWA
jgi:hypothetical protein